MQIKTLFIYAHACSGAVLNLQPRAPPTAVVRNGTLTGRSDGAIDSFIGIPYAQPPVGPLRLRPPQPLNTSFGSLQLPNVAKICPQQNLTQANPDGLPQEAQQIAALLSATPPGQQSEDCLTLNVERPAGTKAGAKLPILFYIYGGGFQNGATLFYNGAKFINDSVAKGQPIMYVAVAYRLSAFGFLAGRELQREGSTNLGLRDQRLAMEWLAENADAFGGDASKVTLFGGSAGAISTYSHLHVNDGDNTYNGQPLFRGAIMNSGSTLPVAAADSTEAQEVFDSVAAAAGCSDANSALDCLREAPYDVFHNASNAQPNYLSYDGIGRGLVYLPREDSNSNFLSRSPWDRTSEAAKVPVIIGDTEDEGTIFSLAQRNLSTTQDLVEYFQRQYPRTSAQQVESLVAAYPDDQAAGSPFSTGNANQLYPAYKRIAAIQGDVTFNLRRRQALAKLSGQAPAWSFLVTLSQGFPILGAFHFSDLLQLFGNIPNPEMFNPELGTDYRAYYINFVNGLDPNGGNATLWPRYESSTLQMLNVSASGYSTLRDDYRQASYEMLTRNGSAFIL